MDLIERQSIRYSAVQALFEYVASRANDESVKAFFRSIKATVIVMRDENKYSNEQLVDHIEAELGQQGSICIYQFFSHHLS